LIPEISMIEFLQRVGGADLSHLGVLRVSGRDAKKFLQGQFTNDVNEVSLSRAQLSAWCSPKGRVLANFWLVARRAGYYLLLPQETLEMMLKRLPMYVLRAEVQLEEVSHQVIRWGLVGESGILTEVLGESTDEITFFSLPGARMVILGENTSIMQEVRERVSQQSAVQLVNPERWQLLDILAGVPYILPVMADEFVPQMLNLQVLGGISFKKGCYTGQEVVARMQYLGTLKSRLYLAKVAMLPSPGEKLYVDGEAQSVGKIVNAQCHPEGGGMVLAVISVSHAHQPVMTSQGVGLELRELP